MELDPKYVDVIILRWQQLTGRDAICAENQEAFEKLASERSGER